MNNRRRPFASDNNNTCILEHNTSDVVEAHMNQQTNEYISNLTQSAKEIKQMSRDIQLQMKDDESLLTELDKGMVKNQNLLKQTMTRIDKMLTSASSNVLCYTILFLFMVLALLWKLTKK